MGGVARSELVAVRDGAENDIVATFSSPACSMHEVSDIYMGYAGMEEEVEFLSELLVAERAGARVPLQSARSAGSTDLAALLRSMPRIRNDRLHADLTDMLRSHENNIALANECLG